MVHLLTFNEIYKERIWGGRNIERLFGKPLPPNVKIGESWELADLPDDKSVANVGPAAGRNVAELIRDWGDDLLGPAKLDAGQFPLLVKILDAQESLSLQVHPDYEMARRLGGGARAKYEGWYVIDAKPGAFLYCGMKPGTTPEMARRAIAEGTLENLLITLPVQKGDFFYLPGGTVHALGAGILVAEVQTPSDTTYRLFDWNRVDAKTGKPRDLHVEQGIAATRFANEPEVVKNDDTRPSLPLACAPTFCATRIVQPAGSSIDLVPGQTTIWIFIAGSAAMADGAVRVNLVPGKTVLIPAGVRSARADFASQSTFLEVKLTS